jgi:hypothetical protein
MSISNADQAVIVPGWSYAPAYNRVGGPLEAAPWVPLSKWKSLQQFLATKNFSIQTQRDAVFTYLSELDTNAPFSWEGRFPEHGFWVCLDTNITANLYQILHAASLKEKFSEVREVALAGQRAPSTPSLDREAAYTDKGEASTSYYKGLRGLSNPKTWSRETFERDSGLTWARLEQPGQQGGGGGRASGSGPFGNSGGRGDTSKATEYIEHGRGD